MITITAIIRAKPGQQDALADALKAVARSVAEDEPDTVGFFISQDMDDPMIFTTYERFVSAEAKDAHNGSEAVAAFFAQAHALMHGPTILHTCTEISAKS